MAFWACTDDEPDTGQTYQQSAVIDVQGTAKTVMLSDLKSKIEDVDYNSDWLQVLYGAYSSGSPRIELRAEVNTGEERSCDVTITDKNGDKVILTVTQEGAEEQKKDIDDSHDVVTDQPAYSR